MSFAFTVPQDYGYVVLTVASTFALGQWHGARVGSYRKRAGIPYPQIMAEREQMAAATPEKKKDMYLYNCAQRAHGNYLENQPSAALAMLISGFAMPRTTVLLGLGWIACRIIYAVGYTRADKENGKGRLAGLPWFLFQFAMIGTSFYTGYQMIR